MKTTQTKQPAPRRRHRHAQKARRFLPKTQERDPQTGAKRPRPMAYANDFLALCLYPGMGNQTHAA